MQQRLEFIMKQCISVVGGTEMFELTLWRIGCSTGVSPNYIVILLPRDMVPSIYSVLRVIRRLQQ